MLWLMKTDVCTTSSAPPRPLAQYLFYRNLSDDGSETGIASALQDSKFSILK
ncbi:hypothetical protein A6R68_11747, partial [Neotoma lepida]